MGAANFSTVSTGATAREAFASAVQQARYEYGHGGYTGTIAEKSDFVIVEVPAGLTAKAFLSAIEGKGSPGADHPEIERAFKIYDDKWGPALGIPLGGNRWLFCGWASD